MGTQNGAKIMKFHVFCYMKMNPRVFVSSAFLIDFLTKFGSRKYDVFVQETPLFASKSHSGPQLGPVGAIS